MIRSKLLRFLCLAVFATVGARFGLQNSQQQPPFQVGGTLRDATTGVPVLNGKVAFHYWVDGPVQDGIFIRNGDGSFVLRDLPRCALFLVGSAPGYGRSVAFVIVDPDAYIELDLRLPRAASVDGILIDANGLTVSGGRVVVKYADRLKDRIAYFAGTLQQARDEGLRIFTFEPSERHRGSPLTNASEYKAEGVFIILDIDPDRPFQLVARHPDYGELESPTMILPPGERLSGYRMQYEREEERLSLPLLSDRNSGGGQPSVAGFWVGRHQNTAAIEDEAGTIMVKRYRLVLPGGEER